LTGELNILTGVGRYYRTGVKFEDHLTGAAKKKIGFDIKEPSTKYGRDKRKKAK
jgi:hypothetical protein